MPRRVLLFAVLFFICLGYGLDSVTWSSDEEYMNVFVVPHSHNDPGWWYTFEGYYTKWTKGIISSVVEALKEDSRRTFIWCETSFFSRWWKDQNQDVRETVKELVKNKQLEFVGGGWVMNDEASVDIHQIINQYTAGHQWLLENIGPEATPTTGWAIDPFGHSSAMAWAHREMGFDGMVINRVHQDIKTEWNENQKLEFAWDRPWNMGNRSCLNNNEDKTKRERWEGEGMLTHMLAYKLYDIPNTCGPDWDVCAKFDFERPVAIPIADHNVHERATTLIDQYRKKHRAFTHNNLLVPLGDDFKYKDIAMTRKMMTSYQKLFDHINETPSFKVRIRFATLREYFDAVKQSMNPEDDLPRYDGDFFTYSDRDSDYWSGYYTTRPYLKKVIRTTESQLRAAQVLFSVVSSEFSMSDRESAYNSLVECSETLGLLQHHDAITGTAKQVVANDYINLITKAKSAIALFTSTALQKLSCKSAEQFTSKQNFIHLQKDQTSSADPTPNLFSLASPQSLVLFNSLNSQYTGIVRVLVDRCHISVTNENEETVPAQIIPVREQGSIASGKFWLFIHVSVPGLSWKALQLKSAPVDYSASISSVYDLRGNSIPFCNAKDSDFPFTLEFANEYYSSVSVNPTSGQIDSITVYGNDPLEFRQRYHLYSTRGGSYLFSPTGNSEEFKLGDLSGFVIRGALAENVISYSESNSLECEIGLYHSGNKFSPLEQRIEVNHKIHMSSTFYNNKELVSHISTGLTGENYWTDSAGLDMIERRYDPKRPIQANFYPITTLASKKDAKSSLQFSVLTRHALGFGSTSEGVYEIMLDRRTMQDDGRGMGEKVTDQAPISISLWYVLRSVQSDMENSQELPLVSQLNYLPESFIVNYDNWENSMCEGSGSIGRTNFLPKGVELFSMYPKSAKGDEIVFRFSQLDPSVGFKMDTVDARSLFEPVFTIDKMEEKTLSLLHTLESNVNSLPIPSMSMRTYIAKITPKSTRVTTLNAHENVGQEIQGLLIPGDLPLLPGEIRNNPRDYILSEAMRHQVTFPFVPFPVYDYYFCLFFCCVVLICFLVLLLQKRKRSWNFVYSK